MKRGRIATRSRSYLGLQASVRRALVERGEDKRECWTDDQPDRRKVRSFFLDFLAKLKGA